MQNQGVFLDLARFYWKGFHRIGGPIVNELDPAFIEEASTSREQPSTWSWMLLMVIPLYHQDGLSMHLVAEHWAH